MIARGVVSSLSAQRQLIVSAKRVRIAVKFLLLPLLWETRSGGSHLGGERVFARTGSSAAKRYVAVKLFGASAW